VLAISENWQMFATEIKIVKNNIPGKDNMMSVINFAERMMENEQN
jgi:hypothetical protein